jgi:hypothetical protein
MSRVSLFLRHRLDPLKAAARHVPPLHHAGFPVTVCWSAKAGCTTMLKWFLHHTGLLGAAEALRSQPKTGWPRGNKPDENHEPSRCRPVFPAVSAFSG